MKLAKGAKGQSLKHRVTEQIIMGLWDLIKRFRKTIIVISGE